MLKAESVWFSLHQKCDICDTRAIVSNNADHFAWLHGKIDILEHRRSILVISERHISNVDFHSSGIGVVWCRTLGDKHPTFHLKALEQVANLEQISNQL